MSSFFARHPNAENRGPDCGASPVNHGIVAYEFSKDKVGAGLWSFAAQAGERVCIAAPRLFEDLIAAHHQQVSAIWRATLIRSLGDVRLAACRGTDEYGRYETDREDLFCRMCRSCISGPMRWALVAPAISADDDLVGMVERCVAKSPSFEKRFPEGRPVRHVVSRLSIGARWVFLLGFYSHRPYSMFLFNDNEIGDKYRRYSMRIGSNDKVDEW